MRILLYMMTNAAILVVISITFRLLGLDQFLMQQGFGNMTGMLIMCAVMGMAGSFISLLMSKGMAKRSTGAVVIEDPQTEQERWLVSTVERQAEMAGIKMPEVAIIPNNTVNAFATGARKNAALVAVTAGLLNTMSRGEAEAVMAHEVAHVANGDMVTMTLIQGVVNTFVLFFSRIIGMVVDKAIFKTRNGYGPGYFITSLIAQVVLSFLASMIVMWFSRWREFHADKGGAEMAGKMNMIGALEALKRPHQPSELPDQLAAFGINGGIPSGLKKLFLSHPPLDERIKALEDSKY